MTELREIRPEDVLPVRSRVSWGAIFAGAVVALAAYLVLALLGSAIGLTISDNVRANSLNTGAAVWAMVTTAAALFLGGWITSQTTVGENKTEAAVHGIIMWGMVLACVLWLASTGVRAGFSAMWGVATAASGTTPEDWQEAARRAGVPQETIDQWREKAKNAPAEIRRATEDPANRQAASEYATQATWYTLLGTVLSMAAAVLGALVGAGPSFRLLAVTGTRVRGSYSRAKEFAGRS